MHVHTQCEVLPVQNRSTIIFPSDNKTESRIGSQESHASHLPASLSCLSWMYQCHPLCDEPLGLSEGAWPSVISVYPFHDKLEYACVEPSPLNKLCTLLDLLMCLCSTGMCVHLKRSTRRHRARGIDTLLLPTTVLKKCGSLPRKQRPTRGCFL